MGEENIYDRAGEPINFFLGEALTQQRNEMMNNFSQDLQVWGYQS